MKKLRTLCGVIALCVGSYLLGDTVLRVGSYLLGGMIGHSESTEIKEVVDTPNELKLPEIPDVYTIEVNYSNGDVDTLDILSFTKPRLSSYGCLVSSELIESAYVRKIKILNK